MVSKKGSRDMCESKDTGENKFRRFAINHGNIVYNLVLHT